MNSCVAGVDFGTSSVRAVVLEAHSGEQLAAGEAGFPRWDNGEFCDPATAQFRQHPAEQIDSLCEALTAALRQAGSHAAQIVGVTIDTTGSTPCAVDRSGRPLALQPRFSADPDAMSIMWKDHSSQPQAEEITAAARTAGGEDYLRFCGGEYSAEWYWAKILRVIRSNAPVAAAAHGWLEHCDWIAALLTGGTDTANIPRSACAAGHKALWNPAYGGYPPPQFFAAIDPQLARLRTGLPPAVATSDQIAGRLSDEWAARLGLPSGVVVGVGLFDAHAGAIGAGVRAGTVVKVMGTSSAEMIVAPPAAIGSNAIAGIESQAEGSMLPGMVGIEAGQSAFGDVYAWFRDLLAWPLRLPQSEAQLDAGSADRIADRILEQLSQEAERRPIGETDPVATDWFNGRRAPFADHGLSAAVSGLTLATSAVQLFQSLVEATAFGTRAIHDLLREAQIPIETVVAVGGIPKKAPYVMQTLADVLETPVSVSSAENASARGAAIVASVAAGIHNDVASAADAMASPIVRQYRPRAARAAVHRARYRNYRELGRFSESALRRSPPF